MHQRKRILIAVGFGQLGFAAVAFCLISLLEFKFQTSLTVARDRVLGVLLGLLMMWLFFDQLWSTLPLRR